MNSIRSVFSRITGLYRYDIALSFAEEDRAFVSEVAQHLKVRGMKIFYDDDKRIETLGMNLYAYLDKVYREDAQHCLMFISKHYAAKRWTGREKDWSVVRSFVHKNKAYIFPVRLDETEIDGVGNAIAYLSAMIFSAEQLADMVAKSVEKNRPMLHRVRTGIKHFFTNKIRASGSILAVGGLTFLGLKDHLTPVDKLTQKLHERSKRTECAICRDGTVSYKHGRGTCSHHKGVDHYVTDTAVYEKTMDDCRKEARNISWITE